MKQRPPNKRPSLFFSDKENSFETMRLGSVVGCFEEENVGDESDAEQSDQESPDKETQKFCDFWFVPGFILGLYIETFYRSNKHYYH